MQLEHSFTVPVGVAQAWMVLLDIEKIAPCLPGAAIDSVDGDDFTGTVKVKLGPIGLTYKGKASFIEKDEVLHRAVIDARGRDARGNGTANAKIAATLTEVEGGTRVDVLTELDITGKPAQFGRGVMVDVGNKLIGQFADCLAGKLTGGTPEPAAAAEPASTADSAPVADPASAASRAAKSSSAAKSASSATVGADSSSAATSAGEAAQPAASPTTQKAASTPKAASTTPAPTPISAARHASPAEVEPINLIESAGPAIAKRLAPVAVAVVVLLVAASRYRARRTP